MERAKAMIMEKIGMPVTASTYGNYGGSSGGGSSWGGDGGAYGQPGGAGVPGGMPGPGGVNPSTGQPDYSAQWADYYRSVGMLREAEAIEQQMRVIYFCFFTSMFSRSGSRLSTMRVTRRIVLTLLTKGSTILAVLKIKFGGF